MTLTKVTLRELTPEERQALEQIASSRTAQARLVERAGILLAMTDGRRPSQVARDFGVCRPTVYTWVRRFQRAGIARSGGSPPLGSAAHLHRRAAGRGHRHRLDRPSEPRPALRLLDAGSLAGLSQRAEGHPDQTQPHRRDPHGGGAAVAASGDLVRRAGRSRLRRKKGVIETLYTGPPEGAVVVCLDEMGPEAAKSFPGQRLVHAEPRAEADGSARPAERAKKR